MRGGASRRQRGDPGRVDQRGRPQPLRGPVDDQPVDVLGRGPPRSIDSAPSRAVNGSGRGGAVARVQRDPRRLRRAVPGDDPGALARVGGRDRSPTRALSSVDLPALTLPAMATRSGSSSRSSYRRAATAGLRGTLVAPRWPAAAAGAAVTDRFAASRPQPASPAYPIAGGQGLRRRAPEPRSAPARRAAPRPAAWRSARSRPVTPAPRASATPAATGSAPRPLAMKWSRSSRCTCRSMSRESLPTWNVDVVDVAADRVSSPRSGAGRAAACCSSPHHFTAHEQTGAEPRTGSAGRTP